MRRQNEIRLAYLSGSVDALAVYRTWAEGRHYDYFGTNYLSQFYEVCSDLDADTYVVTTLPERFSRRATGRLLIENHPTPLGLRGLRFHLAAIAWFFRVIVSLYRFRPHVVIATALQNYWFLLSVLKWTGIVIVPSVHCALWPKFASLRRSWRLLLRLNRYFFVNCCDAVMAVSEDLAEQIRSLAGDGKVRVVKFLPTYPSNQFHSFRPANIDGGPFRIMFGGRIERNKGVFDLVDVAERLERNEPGRFHFDICGNGPDLETLRQRIEDIGLIATVSCHGFCGRAKYSALLEQAHVVIVPTTSNFEEGFNKVCAEAILAGRPVITSAVCPALAYVGDAGIEVPPDSVEGYCEAILALSSDRDLYERKRCACKAVQRQFYDANNSWGAKLREVLGQHAPVGVRAGGEPKRVRDRAPQMAEPGAAMPGGDAVETVDAELRVDHSDGLPPDLTLPRLANGPGSWPG